MSADYPSQDENGKPDLLFGSIKSIERWSDLIIAFMNSSSTTSSRLDRKSGWFVENKRWSTPAYDAYLGRRDECWPLTHHTQTVNSENVSHLRSKYSQWNRSRPSSGSGSGRHELSSPPHRSTWQYQSGIDIEDLRYSTIDYDRWWKTRTKQLFLVHHETYPFSVSLVISSFGWMFIWFHAEGESPAHRYLLSTR